MATNANEASSSSSSSDSSSTSSNKSRRQKNKPGKKIIAKPDGGDFKKNSKKKKKTTFPTCPAMSKVYTYFPTEDVHVFLERFKMAVTLDQIDEEFVTSYLLMNVCGEIYDQLARAKLDRNSPFSEVEKFLRKAYHHRDEPFVAQKKLSERKQLRNERVEPYARSLIALANSAYGDQFDLDTIKKAITLQFINGLFKKSIRKFILMSEVKDFDTAVSQAKKLEVLDKKDGENSSDSEDERKETTSSKKRRRKNGCFVCGEAGHFARDCADKK